MAHVTGSGVLNIPRINDEFDYHLCWPKKLKTTAIFDELKSRGGPMSSEDMFTTFNMGIGLVAAVAPTGLKKALSLGAIYLGEVSKKKKAQARIDICFEDPGQNPISLKY
jgi:phosphoribosylformylglycinamidine cyclo-ligase